MLEFKKLGGLILWKYGGPNGPFDRSSLGQLSQIKPFFGEASQNDKRVIITYYNFVKGYTIIINIT